MITETDGIILKQTRLPDDRRMLVLFTRKFGKISAGTGIRLSGKSKSSLALRVFTHGRYELFFGGRSCNINAAETLNSYFKIGEDVDKYMMASYVLETVRITAGVHAYPRKEKDEAGVSPSDLSVESSGSLWIYAGSGLLRPVRRPGGKLRKMFFRSGGRTDL